MPLWSAGILDGMDRATTIADALNAPAARYELRCWGVLRLRDRVTGGEHALRSRKARAVLGYLARQPGVAVTRERLAALLWGDHGQEQARSSLRQALRELREIGASPALVHADREMVRLNAEALDTDVRRFERLALADDLDGLTADLSAASGPLFADLDGTSPEFDDWLRTERLRADDQRAELAVAAAENGLERGELESVLALVRCLEAIDSTNESVVRLGMRAELARGDPGGARRRYKRLREAMARELGVEPSLETERLHNLARTSAKRRRAGVAAAAPESADPRRLRAIMARPARRWAAVLAVLVAAALGAVLVPQWLSSGSAPASIAVLPFRDLSPGDDYFAEGLAEEILSQLSREPRLRVAGSTSSRLFKDRAADAREIGRSLEVDYVLEGSVRRDGDRVRVDVTLVDTDDGMRLWSQPFAGRMDDIFTIQRDIAGEILGRLRLQLVQVAPETGALATSGEVYASYLIARGLMRTRDPGRIASAIGLLNRAVQRDPNFAPARARLAAALRMSRWAGSDGRREEAIGHAKRALTLAPDLAEAHAILGMILETDPAAIRHLERAVRLDPGNAETWYWLGSARIYAGDFEGAIEAGRRAAAIDPFWVRISGVSELAWQMGYREEATRYEQRIIDKHPQRDHREMAKARMAARRGDWSGYVLHSRKAAQVDVERDIGIDADIHADYGMLRLGLPFELTVLNPVTTLWHELAQGDIPASLDRVPGAIAKPRDFWDLPDVSAMASRLLVNRGRGAELVALYDGAFGSPDALAAANPGHGFLYHAPAIAFALRESGRVREADHMLALADHKVRTTLQRGRAPGYFHVLSAGIWAARGRHDEALAALERAVVLGWPLGSSRSPWLPRPVLAEEPAFRSIRDDPRLKRIDAGIQTNIARERRKLEAARAA